MTGETTAIEEHPQPGASTLEIFSAFLRLGLTSFGGPIAHLGYFRTEFVERRRWLDEHAYADLVALCQFLPGPASSQVGIGLGLLRGGLRGAIAAWLGFTLPSALVLALFAIALGRLGPWDGAWLHGLKVVAVAVVAQALWGMGKTLCPDARRASIAVAATAAMAALPGVFTQLAVIAAAAAIGWRWLTPSGDLPHSPFPIRIGKRTGLAVLLAFCALLALLPVAASQSPGHAPKLFSAFFRAGSLVFGGGHVVLPLLQALTVPSGWVSADEFLAGYGAAQAVPGPLFTFAAYLGAASHVPPAGWVGAAVATIAIFLPSFFLVIGALPLWEGARRHQGMQQAMLGINAAVVGLLLAAFYDPVWTAAIHSAKDFALAAGACLLLVFWKLPPWLVVIICAASAGLGWH